MAPVHQEIAAVPDTWWVITWWELQVTHVIHTGLHKGWHDVVVRNETRLQRYKKNRFHLIIRINDKVRFCSNFANLYILPAWDSSRCLKVHERHQCTALGTTHTWAESDAPPSSSGPDYDPMPTWHHRSTRREHKSTLKNNVYYWRCLNISRYCIITGWGLR